MPEPGTRPHGTHRPVAPTHLKSVQLSFPPVYSHAENVCRVPAYLPHVLSLNEHRGGYDETIIPMEDLANIASHRLRRHPEATLFEHARDRGRECSYRRSRPPWVSLRC